MICKVLVGLEEKVRDLLVQGNGRRNKCRETE
jgi:hypothetical protein